MKRITVLGITICIFFTSCQNNQTRISHIENDPVAKKEERYLRIIDSLGIHNLYDKTKWSLYCLHCDDTLDFTSKSNIVDTITYASLDLHLDTFIVAGDSIEIDFRFYYKGIPCDINLVYETPWWGIRYTNGSDSTNCYTSDGTLRYYWPGDPQSRYLNASHPDVIKYINSNKEKLNLWFFKEAERRGLIK